MNRISINNKLYTAPSKWDDIDAKRLCLWVAALYSSAADHIKIQLAIPMLYLIPERVAKKLTEADLKLIAPRIQFATNSNKLTRWVIPSVRVWFKKYYGPADKLSNLTAHEFFNYCEPLYWRWKESQTHHDAVIFCAMLYREKRSGPVDNDIRAELTEAGIATRINRFNKLPKATILAILFNYEGCRNFITRQFKTVFKKAGNEFQKHKNPAMADVTLSLAGGDSPLGTLNEARKTNLYTFLTYLVQLMERDEN